MKKFNRFIVFSLMLSLGFWACSEEEDGLGLPTTPKPVLELDAADVTLSEGNEDTILKFPVRLEGLNLTNVVVSYGKGSGTAAEGQDFIIGGEGKFLFSPSSVEKFIEVTIRADLVKEEDETFELILFDPHNADLGKDKITITILNDDINPADFIPIPATGYSTPASYDGYQLAWQDEFEGEALDPGSWTYEEGDGCPNLCGWGNNELEYYTEDNTLLVNGNLIIEARRENAGNRAFTSARIITKDKREFQYGRIDIRAALPAGRGFWPALWMLGANIDDAGWPACGEIDIMELTGDRPNRVIGTAHFGASIAEHRFRTAAKFLPAGEKFSDEFHVFSIIWKEDLIEWYLDDERYHTIVPADLGGQPYPFNQPFFFIFNLAVGGTLPGSPDETTTFPNWVIVDYIRVFQEN